MKRVFPFLLLSTFVVLALTGATPSPTDKEGPFVIHDIVLDPQNPQLVYAATSNYGILKSSDGGTTWKLTNQGLQSYTHHTVVVNPANPKILYAGAWGGGVSKSEDQGAHWTGVNDHLGNTAIEDLVLDPIHPEQIYAATTTGVFKSPDGGIHWMPFSEGLPISKIEIFQCLMVFPSGPIELLLGTSQGLFKRERNAPAWEAINGVVMDQHITDLAFQSETPLFYAGTRKDGVLKSQDGGRSWALLGGKIRKTWVSDIVLDPLQPRVIYASTRGNGILKSQDGGITWSEVNWKFPVKDIRRLAIDPKDPRIVYAGTTHGGLAKTTNGGKEWVKLTGYPLLSVDEIMMSLSHPKNSRRKSPRISVPPAFSKCDQCHGWTDPLLSSKKTYWRVVTNKRDWRPTVERMSIRARLTPEEASQILEFLTIYTQGEQ